MKFTVRNQLLGSTALIGATVLGLGHAAVAQTATPTPDAGPAVQEVVVTGSRIRSPSLTSSSPLTTVGSQEISNIGATGVEQLLNQLPSVVPGQTSNLSGLSDGTATVNLRGLGSVRTLVLVDGKRLMPGDATGINSPAPDLNVIPAGLVDRVDVVTGGASAVYGSDAVAGVVNFIMKRNFEGFHIEVTDSGSSHNNNNNAARQIVSDAGFFQAPRGEQFYNLSEDINAILGINSQDGKGNVTAYAGYRHLEPILQGQYDYSACTVSASQGRSPVSTVYAGHACGGSSNSLYGKFTNALPASTISALGATAAPFHNATDGSKTFVTTGVPSYNYGATNYFQRSDTRYTAGFFGHYDLDPKISIYSDFMFADDQTDAQAAASGLFQGTGYQGASTYNINCNNPLLSTQQAKVLCGSAAGTSLQVPVIAGFRFGQFPRGYNFNHTDYKIDIGAKGSLGGGWTYDTYLQYGTARVNTLVQNDVSTTKIQNALLVNPNGTCITGGSSCVPLNIFQFGGVTPAQFAYLSTPGEQQGQTVEQIASASVSGNLGQYGIKSPFATDGVGVAFGTEYRRESLNFQPDNEYITKDLSGSSPAVPNRGSFDVYELFGEARVPIIQNLPFVKELAVDTGYRFSDYSSAGETDTYKLQIEYAPTPDIRFRGGYNRAVRAPNVVELFKPQNVLLGAGPDPCVGAKPTASLAACVATGLPAALYGTFSNGCPAGQCGVLVGGNPALKPETSDTFTGGFVFTPTLSWARGFTASIDYFHIKVEDVISAVPAAVSSSECASGNVSVCSSAFVRDPATHIIFGSTGYIVQTNINSGYFSTDGIDFELNYRKRLSDWGLPDVGVITANLLGTYTHSLITQPVKGEGTYNCAGLFGLSCGNPVPKLKGKFRVTYAPNFAPITISAQWRYVGDAHLDANTSNPLLSNHPYGITDVIDNSIHPYSYLDLTLVWRVRDKITMTIGCNNVLDKDPPVFDANTFVDAGTVAGNGNTYPGTYDVLGRTAFVKLAADF